MPAQVSREALGKLVQELSTKNFTSSVINRLRNEDPGYAHLANFFADKAKSEMGESGAKLALECFAIFYRIGELSERYPDTQRLLNDAPEGDPLQTATKEQAASALAEMKAGFSRWGKPLEK